ncbi:MAG: alpha/beta fold hydrolase [Congregibacter sp.]
MLMQRLSVARTLVLVASLTIIALALYKLHLANQGVQVTKEMLGPTPVQVFRDSTDGAQSKPVVVISHGFAGSQQLMQGFAVNLAKNGYIAVSFDYFGHGANGEALSGDVTQIEGATQSLLEQTRAVTDFAKALPDANGKLAVLGHSMASDIIVRFAQSYSGIDAVVAVSMFSPAVTPEKPRNLLVIVGGLEGFLKAEALRVLAMVTDSPTAGQTVQSEGAAGARRVAFAPGVEHVGVLYSATSMLEATQWLDQHLGHQSRAYVDARGPWIMLLLLGVGALAWPLSGLLPRVSKRAVGASLRWKPLLIATAIPAVATPLLLVAFPSDFLGVLVGGYLAVHFFVFGAISALCAFWLRRETTVQGAAIRWPAMVFASVLTTLYCAVLVNALLNEYVTSFAITALRLPLLLAMLVGTLCYFMADEWLAHGEHAVPGAHFSTRLAFLLSLALAVALSFEELFFLVIIAAVIIIYFFVYALFSRWIYRATGHPFVGAFANAVAFAWALAAVFPFIAES